MAELPPTPMHVTDTVREVKLVFPFVEGANDEQDTTCYLHGHRYNGRCLESNRLSAL